MIALRKYSYPVNAVSAGTQITGALCALIGTLALHIKGWTLHISAGKHFALSVYGVSLIIMFVVSALYHMKGREIWHRLDHSSIYFLIGGTYTPIFLLAPTGSRGPILCLIFWVLCLAGIIEKLFWFHRQEKISILTYLVLGWAAIEISAIDYVRAGMGPHILLAGMNGEQLGFLLAGGAFYSFGAYIYARHDWVWIPGLIHAHEIWHLFVLAGATLHFWMVWACLN